MRDQPHETDPTPAATGARVGAGLGQVQSANFDLGEAVGGVRGLIESVVPGLVFIVAFIVSGHLGWSIGLSLGTAAVATIARLIQGSPITQALSGIAGIVIGALWAWRTGEAADFFVWGLYMNAAFATGTIVSILVRRPLVGLFVSGFVPQAGGLAGARRVFTSATWLWAGAFLARLAVQVPLYLSTDVAWLGTARLVMGVPLWALVMWFTWLLVRPVVAAGQRLAEAETIDAAADAPEADKTEQDKTKQDKTEPNEVGPNEAGTPQ